MQNVQKMDTYELLNFLTKLFLRKKFNKSCSFNISISIKIKKYGSLK
uniref:Uncharacterized protein n=1 Tax=Lepeophtheirus salmonis TaxID=72036 RepID=A0A0K2T2H9_LEPSM